MEKLTRFNQRLSGETCAASGIASGRDPSLPIPRGTRGEQSPSNPEAIRHHVLRAAARVSAERGSIKHRLQPVQARVDARELRGAMVRERYGTSDARFGVMRWRTAAFR